MSQSQKRNMAFSPPLLFSLRFLAIGRTARAGKYVSLPSLPPCKKSVLQEHPHRIPLGKTKQEFGEYATACN